MTTALHKNLPVAEIHAPISFEYADQSARESATGFTSDDIRKFARQTDDNSVWMLTATTPTWVAVGGSGGAVNSVFGRTGSVTAQSGDYTHSQIGSVGANDHHDKSHAHDGVDGSGTVAHSDTTGQTANDHHNQTHDLGGGDHNSATKAQLDAKVSDASLISTKASEISALTEKTDVVGDDLLLLEDSEDSNAKKRAKVENLPAPIFGQGFQEASSEGQSSHTGDTNWSQKLRMTTPSLPDGKYRIGWSYEWNYDDASAAYFGGRVQVNDADTIHEIYQEPQDIDNWYQQGGFKYHEISSGPTVLNIDIDYRSSTSLATAYIRNARLEIWRVS